MHNYALSPVLLLGEFIMKKTITIILVLLLASFIPLFSAGSKEVSTTPSYIFAANCAWPPLEFVDENGDIVGFEIDLVHEIAKVQNVKITIQNVAWDGIFAGLSNGAYDAVASGVSITDERKKTMGFSTPHPVDHPSNPGSQNHHGAHLHSCVEQQEGRRAAWHHRSYLPGSIRQ